jgi:2-polyprenyl-3-methyl-5-hydroxy-6-metoxy-1,4-benzoquinol methylase
MELTMENETSTLLIDLHDKVTEAYYGQMGETLMNETRKRIHWICQQVKGTNVLDVGCSQGILPLLLGREGKSVLGLDISQKAIDFAKNALVEEAEDVRHNVSYLRANFMLHDFGTDRFETIIIAEVLEHLVNPQDFINKAKTLLVENGTLIVTVPFGINDFIDHKHTYYLTEMHEMLGSVLHVTDVSILGKWIGFIASNKQNMEEYLFTKEKLQALEKAFFTIERELIDANKAQTKVLQDCREKYRHATQELSTLKEKTVSLQKELSMADATISDQAAHIDSQRLKLEEADATISDQAAHIDSQRLKLEEADATISDQAAHIDSQRLKLEEADATISDQVANIDSQRLKLEEADKRIASLQKELDTANKAKSNYINLSKNEHNLFLGCRNSASYRLGHLLIHETRSLKDFLSLPAKIKKIKESKKNTPRLESNPSSIPVQYSEEKITISPETIKTYESKKSKPANEIKVALLCDEFSYNSWKYEFDAITFGPENWLEVWQKEKPELFLCESAWSGIDSVNRPWKGKIYASKNFKHENRTELLSILEYCTTHNIPTIFWNKEDPTHYDDRVHDFAKTAILFDYIFTTAYECIEKYKNDYGCKNVYCLPFATQPKLFNPIEKYNRSDYVVFAGSWYAQHPERSSDMERIFDAILRSGRKLVIYDRHSESNDKNHIFPQKYDSFLKPSVKHEEIEVVYKSSLFGLNINTVKNSSTMFARRVFELISSNTLVVSNSSDGMHQMLESCFIDLEKDPNGLNRLSMNDIENIREKALHEVLHKHTYQKRFEEILDAIQYAHKKNKFSLTFVYVADSEEDVQKILRHYRKQKFEHKKLLIVLSKQIPDIEIARFYEQYNNSISGVIAYSYLEKYSNNWSKTIETQYICLLDFKTEIDHDRISKAILHKSYVDEPIKLNSEHKYTFASSTDIVNIIFKKNQFQEFLINFKNESNRRIYNV